MLCLLLLHSLVPDPGRQGICLTIDVPPLGPLVAGRGSMVCLLLLLLLLVLTPTLFFLRSPFLRVLTAISVIRREGGKSSFHSENGGNPPEGEVCFLFLLLTTTSVLAATSLLGVISPLSFSGSTPRSSRVCWQFCFCSSSNCFSTPNF